MVYRKRSRSQAQKVRRKFNDRLSTLRSKIKELNAIKENRAIIVWTEKDEHMAYGDKQLLKKLGFPVRDFQNPLCCPASSPTSSVISAASSDRRFEGVQNLSEDGEAYDSQNIRKMQSRPTFVNENSLRLHWRKEDLDSLAFNFFSD